MTKKAEKKKPGPKKMKISEAMQTRKYRANESQMAKISKRAAKAGYPVSTYIRMRALGEL